ncbi:unnamed protein product, partial [Didymodactylos carnosus]
VQNLIDSQLEKEPLPPKDSVTVFQHFDKRHSEPCLIPQCAPVQNLSAVRQKLEAVFLENDANGDGFMTLEEFELFLPKLNLKMSPQDMSTLFKEINRKNAHKLTFQEFFQYFDDMIQGRKAEHTQAELDLLQAFLKADKEGKCEVGGITQFINKRWEKFNNFKRDGKTGKLVMVGGVEAKDVLPGEYSLVDLITWTDLEPQDTQLKFVKISGVRWTKSDDPKSKSGSLSFPKDFDRRVPIETGTSDKLNYYGCCLANESQVKV